MKAVTTGILGRGPTEVTMKSACHYFFAFNHGVSRIKSSKLGASMFYRSRKAAGHAVRFLVATIAIAVLLPSIAVSAPPTSWASNECATVGQPCTPDSPTSRKFFPGFYAGLGSGMRAMPISLIANRGEYAGVVRIYTWRSLEPTLGNYDFSLIDADKAIVTKAGRKLGIYFRMAKISAGGKPLTPSYMWDDPSYGGVIAGRYGNYLGSSNNSWWKPIIWNPKVKNRIYALLDALAKRYDNDPDIAFIIFIEETTEGATTADDPGYTCSTNIQALKDIFTYAWSVLPNTPTLMELDWACTDIPTALHQFIVDGGVGAWTIDAQPCNAGLDRNAYSLYRNQYNEIASLIFLDGWNDINKKSCYYTANQILAELGPGKTMQPRYFLADLTNSTTRPEIMQAVDTWWTQHGKVWPLNQPPAGWK